MALDVKNLAAGDTGNSQNIGRITVKANRNTYKKQAAPIVPPDFLIAKFDLATDPVDGTILKDRFDDPRYYQGDAVT